jgi:hypothetical protein
MDMSKYKSLGYKLRGLLEKETNEDYQDPPSNSTELIKEVIEAYKEARELTDEYLYEDHTKWLKTAFNNGWFEFPDDYDFLSSRWTLGLMLAQTERYGGIVMETKKGTLPVSLDTPIPDGREYRITEGEE